MVYLYFDLVPLDCSGRANKGIINSQQWMEEIHKCICRGTQKVLPSRLGGLDPKPPSQK